MGQKSAEEEFDMKQNRLERPTGWMKLTRYETVRFIVDALLESSPDHKFNKSELSRRTGMSREAIREHIPLLIDLGVVNKITDSGWAEYQLNGRNRVTKELLGLNSAINAIEAGQTKNLKTKEFKIKDNEDMFIRTPNVAGAFVQPYSVEEYSEKTTVASDHLNDYGMSVSISQEEVA